jgi:membrane protease YdiL (CAAX protease family)
MIATAAPATAAAPIDKRGIIAFLLINFGLTWGLEFTMLARGTRFDQTATGTTLTLLTAMLLPALSAFIVRRWVTREGFASAGLKFGSWKPYLAVWLAVPAAFGVVYLLSLLLGSATFDPSMAGIMATLHALAPDKALPTTGLLLGGTFVATLTFGLLITCVATFGEEFGWTGFLLPKLLPLGKWRAALTYGLIWGLWHAPIIWGGYNYPGYPVIGIFAMCLFTCALGLTMTALRLRYGSVLLTAWVHGSVNAQARGIWALLFMGVQPLLGGIVGLPGLVVLGLVGAWLLARTPEPSTTAA